LIAYGSLFLFPWIFKTGLDTFDLYFYFYFDAFVLEIFFVILISIIVVPVYLAITGFFIPRFLYKLYKKSNKGMIG